MRRFIKNRTHAQATAAGSLNLLLSGFSQQEMIPIDDIVRSVDRLPDFHLQGLRGIVYLPEGAPDTSVLAGPYPVYPRCDPKGEFIQTERRIFVYGFDSPAMFFHMLHHEIGHFVFFLAISSAVKKLWVNELSRGSSCVTAYAGTNPWEDFAETYAYFVLQPRLLEDQLPVKHAFMRDCVFSGHPATLKGSDRLA
jgi:hypothetical protein